MPDNLGRQDLTGLAGLLPRRQASRPAPTAVTPLAPDDPPAAPEPASTVPGLQAEPATSPSPRRRSPSRKKTSEGTGDGELVQVGLQLPRSIADRIRAAKETSGKTTAAVIIEAVNSTHDQLTDQWTVEAPVGPLAPQPARTPTRKGDNVQQMPVRLGRGNLGKLDGLVEAAKAPSRSAYVSAALDAYLPHI